MKPLYLRWPVFQLDVRGERGGGGGGLQETAIVEEAEDSATLLGKGIKDETILCSRERKKSRGQNNRVPRLIYFRFKVQF